MVCNSPLCAAVCILECRNHLYHLEGDVPHFSNRGILRECIAARSALKATKSDGLCIDLEREAEYRW